LPIRAKGNRCRIIVPAQPEYPAAPVRDFVSGAYISVTTFEIFEHVAQLLRGSFGIEPKYSVDDVVRPSPIGWV
jgi:hypothetical protein